MISDKLRKDILEAWILKKRIELTIRRIKRQYPGVNFDSLKLSDKEET